MLRVGVLVSGGGSNLAALLLAKEHGLLIDIVTVVSSNPKAYALERAKNAGIEALTIRKKDFKHTEEADRDKAFDQALSKHFKDRNVELVLLAGYLSILGKDFVREFKGRILNIHPSLIPAFCGPGYYGLKVHEAALERGVKVTGATVHFVDEGTDTGKIILQKAVYVKDDDTPETLQKRVMEEAEWIIFPQAVSLYIDKKI